jgi:2-amino-4-hydroxy-6-hydroxymethyldihydropteridine diphosphokinase
VESRSDMGSAAQVPGEPGHGAGPRRVRAYVGLGANLGDPPATMAAAIVALGALPGASLAGVSRLYRTRPVGPVEQPDFHNAVAGLDVPAGPDPASGALALLVALKGLERAMGRHAGRRWGPRALDLDLLIHGPHHIRVTRPELARGSRPERPGVQWLEVPHPSAAERLFVLAPLADLAPDLVPPGWPEPVAAAARRAREREGREAVRVVGAWDPAARAWTRRPPPTRVPAGMRPG